MMADDIGAPSTLAGWNVRIIFGSIVLGFCMSIIAYLVLKGSPTNSLHESALTGAFFLIAAILAGFGVGTVAERVLALLNKK